MWCKNNGVFPLSARGQQLAETETYSLQRVAVVEEIQCAAFSQKSFQKYQIGVFYCTNCSLFTVWFIELLMSCSDLSSTSSLWVWSLAKQNRPLRLAEAHNLQILVGSLLRKSFPPETNCELFLQPWCFCALSHTVPVRDMSGKSAVWWLVQNTVR